MRWHAFFGTLGSFITIISLPSETLFSISSYRMLEIPLRWLKKRWLDMLHCHSLSLFLLYTLKMLSVSQDRQLFWLFDTLHVYVKTWNKVPHFLQKIKTKLLTLVYQIFIECLPKCLGSWQAVPLDRQAYPVLARLTLLYFQILWGFIFKNWKFVATLH